MDISGAREQWAEPRISTGQWQKLTLFQLH